MSDWGKPEVIAAIDVIIASGIPVGAWKILSRSNRLVPKLRPSGWIAKVVRTGDSARLSREFAIARHVAAQNDPAVPPALGTGVMLGQAVAVSLWEPAEGLAPPADTTICRVI